MAAEYNAPEETLRLREYLGVLFRRKWSIIAITLLATVGALFYAQQQKPVYASTASVQATVPLASQQGGGVALPNMDTEQQFVTSENVTKCASVILAQAPFQADPAAPLTSDLNDLCSTKALAVIDITALKDLNKHVSVTFPQQATVLQITYSDNLKKRAQAGAEAFALAYVQIRTTGAITTLESLRGPVQAQADALNKTISGLNKQISDVLDQILSLTDNTQLAPLNAQLIDLEQQRNTEQQQLQQLNLSLLGLDPSKVSPPTVLLPAKLPKAPVSPNKTLDGALGLLVGLAFGVGLAFLRERLDDGLRGRGDLEERAGVPVLAVIPKVPGWRKRQETKLVSLEQPKGAVAEAYRTLRTSVLFTAVQRGMKTNMVVSATAGEGKTTTAANLAVSLADANKRVILVSADLRKPRIHRFFDLENSVGLSNVLAGEIKPWEALQDPKVDNLRVMASGGIPARPSELLQSEQMGELIVELREVADFVILDTAPILLVSDALSLAPLVDGVLYVADSEATTRGAVSHAREQLEQVGAPILGAALNNFDPSKGRSYYYPYYYPYRYRYGKYGYGSRYGYGESYAPANGGRRPAGEEAARRLDEGRLDEISPDRP